LLVSAVTVGFGLARGHNRAVLQAIKPHRIADFITVRPVKEPVGSELWVTGHVAGGPCPSGITIYYSDAANVLRVLGSVPPGDISFVGNIPVNAALGPGMILALRGVPDPHNPGRCHAGRGAQAPFTVTNGPGIYGFVPRSGPVGTSVQIMGFRFSEATKVKFNGVPAVFKVASESRIIATVPTGATTGQIKILTPYGKAKSRPNFVVT